MSEDQINRVNQVFDNFLTRVDLEVQRGELTETLLGVVVSLFDYKQGTLHREEQQRNNDALMSEILQHLRGHGNHGEPNNG